MRAWPLARMKSPRAGLRHAVCSGLGAAWAMKHAHIAPVPAKRSTCTLQLLGKCDEAGQVHEAADHSSAGILNPQASPRAPEQQAHCCTNKYRTAACEAWTAGAGRAHALPDLKLLAAALHFAWQQAAISGMAGTRGQAPGCRPCGAGQRPMPGRCARPAANTANPAKA